MSYEYEDFDESENRVKGKPIDINWMDDILPKKKIFNLSKFALAVAILSLIFSLITLIIKW